MGFEWELPCGGVSGPCYALCLFERCVQDADPSARLSWEDGGGYVNATRARGNRGDDSSAMVCVHPRPSHFRSEENAARVWVQSVAGQHCCAVSMMQGGLETECVSAPGSRERAVGGGHLPLPGPSLSVTPPDWFSLATLALIG